VTVSVREETFTERNRLSVLTFWLNDIEPLTVPRVLKSKSQPEKLLALSVVVMTCLCGSIYFATYHATTSTPSSGHGLFSK